MPGELENRKLNTEKATLYLLWKEYVREEDTSRTFVEWLELNGLFIDPPPYHAIEKLWRKHNTP